VGRDIFMQIIQKPDLVKGFMQSSAVDLQEAAGVRNNQAIVSEID
tara:strand:- start:781 stop:915 length:135 start_codon:yes stop_codon:yes gene_type:complete